MGEGSASSSSSSSEGSGRGSGGSACSSGAPCHGAAGPLSFFPFSCVPRLGEVPIFDLMTLPWDQAGMKAS